MGKMESAEVEIVRAKYFPSKERHNCRRRRGHSEWHVVEGRGLNVFIIREEGDLKKFKT